MAARLATGSAHDAWHITLANQPDLHAAVRECQARLDGLPGLDLVPTPWLHLTTQGIGFTDEVPDADVRDIINGAAERLATTPPITVGAGPLTVDLEGVTLPVAPVGELRLVREALRAAIAGARSPAHVPETADWVPHISVA